MFSAMTKDMTKRKCLGTVSKAQKLHLGEINNKLRIATDLDASL